MNAHPPLPPAAAAPAAVATPVLGAPAADAPDAPRPVIASGDAKRVAGAILEVLAGVRSITDAALLLGVAPARYYTLEARAIAGLIAACEPRARGPAPGAGLQAEVDRLRAERDRLREEAARYQALARIAQAAFGAPVAVPAAPPPARNERRRPDAAARTDAPKPRKKRVATVRALRLARQVHDPRGVMTDAASTAATPAPIIARDPVGG